MNASEGLLLIELDERDIYLVDTVLLGYDGIAHLRRDYRLIDNRKFFELLVPCGFLDEVQAVLEELRGHVRLGEVRRADGAAGATATG